MADSNSSLDLYATQTAEQINEYENALQPGIEHVSLLSLPATSLAWHLSL